MSSKPLGNPSDWGEFPKDEDPSVDQATGIRKISNEEKEKRRSSKERSERDRKEKRSAVSRNRALNVASLRLPATILLIIGIIFIIILVIATANGYDRRVDAKNERISQLESDKDASDRKIDDVADPEVIRRGVDDAKDVGNQLTAIQDEMRAIDVSNARNDAGIQRYGELTDEIKKFMSNSAAASGGFRPNGAWYRPMKSSDVDDQGRQVTTMIPADQWAWTMTVTDGLADGQEIPVMWEGRFTAGEHSGGLLAVVTAQYDPQRRVFHKFSRVLTGLGQEFVGVSWSQDTNDDLLGGSTPSSSSSDTPHVSAVPPTEPSDAQSEPAPADGDEGEDE